ncbi:MAG: hypothetical protein ACREH8_09875, partial [Opitutaceae bacterium]
VARAAVSFGVRRVFSATAREDLEQKKPAATVEQNSGKRVLAFHVSPEFVLLHLPEAWPHPRAQAAPSWSERVPVPPPRA